MDKNELTRGAERTFELTKDQMEVWRKSWFAPGTGHTIVFLLALPCYAVMSFFILKGAHTNYWVVSTIAAGLVWLFMFGTLFVTWRERKQRPTRIVANNVGLTLYGYGGPTSVNWFEVNDVCLASTAETAIFTKHGTFFMPTHSPWHDEFIELVRSRAANVASSKTSLCLQFTEGFRMQSYLPAYAIIIAVVFGSLRYLAGAPVVIDAGAVILSTLLFIGAIAYLRFVRSIPVCVRANPDGLIVQNVDGERRLAWTQIRGTKHLGKQITFVETNDGKFPLVWLCFSPMVLSRKPRTDIPPQPKVIPEKDQFLQLTSGRLLPRRD